MDNTNRDKLGRFIRGHHIKRTNILRGKNHPRWLGDKRAFVCKGCGIKFRDHRPRRVYCSRKCHGLSMKKRKILKCDYCRKEYSVPSSTEKWNKIRGHKHNFCSRLCKSHSFTGNNHPRWIIDRNGLKCRPLGNVAHKEWKKLIFERDDYTCVLCREKGGRLESHHIKRWKDYPELRYDTDNGVTLCIKCHYKTRGSEKEFEQPLLDYIFSVRCVRG